MNLARLCAVLLAVWVPGAAQSIFVPSDSPGQGVANTVPFGERRVRYQSLVSHQDLQRSGGLRICDLAFAALAPSRALHLAWLEVTLAQTNAPLGSDFDANLKHNAVVVLRAHDHHWRVTGGRWNTLGLDLIYDFQPGSYPYLVVQIQAVSDGLGGAFRRDSTVPRVFATGFQGGFPNQGSVDVAGLKLEVLTGRGDTQAFGLGCVGGAGRPKLAVGGGGQLGGLFTVDLAGCVPRAPILQMFALRRLAVPLDLSAAGAPGCALYIAPEVIVGHNCDALGRLHWQIRVPTAPNLLCTRVYTQSAPLDAGANSLGRTTSNYGRLLIGR